MYDVGFHLLIIFHCEWYDDWYVIRITEPYISPISRIYKRDGFRLGSMHLALHAHLNMCVFDNKSMQSQTDDPI